MQARYFLRDGGIRVDKVRVGIIGLGNMGIKYAKAISNGEVKGAVLAAICIRNSERFEWVKQTFGDKVQLYSNEEDFFEQADMDGVLIATPHYDHPEMAMKAFKNGLHVLCEKPAGVYTKNVRDMNDVAEKSGKVFSMMFNQRTNPLYQKVRELIRSGELGEIKRTNWTITDWYRTQSYYDSVAWRGTWAGDGGGVMLNQSPHQLDLWQWITGMMPVRVRAFCGFGKYRDIEVEDDVTTYVEYENGATGIFVTSTGEAPGTNRFEIVGDQGKIIVEDNKITFWRLLQPESEFNLENTVSSGRPEYRKINVPFTGEATQHVGIMNNWIDAIINGVDLLAPGKEGIKSLTISNAVYLSSWIDGWVEIPIDEDLYYEKLQDKINKSSIN